MEIQNEMKSVEQILLSMQRLRSIQPPFKLPYSYDDVRRMIVHGVGVEVNYRHHNFVIDENLSKAIDEAAKFLTDGKKFGLLICGTLGNGKTTLLRGLQTVINSIELKDRYGEDYSVCFYTAMDICRAAKENKDRLRKIIECPALAIDDLGEEPIEVLVYGNSSNPLIDLLSYRYEKQLLTMITTNLGNAKIRNAYGDRIADRFNEMMQVIIFTNPSFRTPQQ